MKCVFILGAGASREAGGPLMSDFLDIADELRRVGASGVREAAESFNNVFSAISELQGVYAKSHLDLDNIEALFGAIEMGVLLGKFAERDEAAIRKLRDDMVTLIYKTLETSISFPVSGSQIHPPRPYATFVEAIYGPRDEPPRAGAHELAFITFNYDLALDYALYCYRGTRCDYGLSTPLPRNAIPLLKLHGSLNWGACSVCQEIVPHRVEEARFNLWSETKYVNYNLGSSLPKKLHHDKPLPLPPVIVPPTWNKTDYREQLSTVWRHAARVLAEAENLFIIGYSLPETDSFFRYLFALGSESKSRIRRFWVFDPDPSTAVENRFRELIGRGIENRFLFHRMTFSEAIPIIRTALREA